MIGSWKRSLRVALTAAFLTLFSFSSHVRAEVIVAIRYDSEDLVVLAKRLESELLSAGYTVDVRSPPEPSPCDQNAGQFVPVADGTSVWIHLRADPDDIGTIVASICYLGTLPLIQRAAVRAPGAETQKLALATAEAVNGLRAKLPPWAGNPDRAPNDGAERPSRAQVPTPDEPAEGEARSRSLANSMLLGTAVVWNAPDFPAAPGIVGRATLGVVPSFGIVIDAFVPTTGRELESSEVTATLRTTWLRVGPRFGGALGDFELTGAALAGPAVTWVTGEAEPPRLGTTDVTTGAVLSLAAFVEYPRHAAVFACASASASALLPAVEVDLADGTVAPRGAWPIEASVGFGARWGGNR